MRVLFVVREFLPKPTPTGLCVMNLREALFKRGVKNDVLMLGDKAGLYCSNDCGDVYSIKSGISFEKKKQGILKYLLIHIPMVFTWPIPSTKRVKEYRRVISELNEKQHYDAIIGTMFPPDVCVSCAGFEHFFYYELDSLINNPMYKQGMKKYMVGRLRRLEKKLFNRSELIIHLNHNKVFYSKKQYEKYSGKSVYTDIPNLVDEALIEENTDIRKQVLSDKRPGQFLLVYSGFLSGEYRSPSRLIELIKEISKTKDIKCLFFSRGDCEDELRRAEAETNGVIKRMGYVSQEVLSQYTDCADFLLDIGNKLSGEDYSLPSKIICYMAKGKPIIHLNGTNDIAISYLDKYGLALNVDDKSEITVEAARVLNFMEESVEKRIDFSVVSEKFPQNTPEYTADLIIRQIKSRSN